MGFIPLVSSGGTGCTVELVKRKMPRAQSAEPGIVGTACFSGLSRRPGQACSCSSRRPGTSLDGPFTSSDFPPVSHPPRLGGHCLPSTCLVSWPLTFPHPTSWEARPQFSVPSQEAGPSLAWRGAGADTETWRCSLDRAGSRGSLNPFLLQQAGPAAGGGCARAGQEPQQRARAGWPPPPANRGRPLGGFLTPPALLSSSRLPAVLVPAAQCVGVGVRCVR